MIILKPIYVPRKQLKCNNCVYYRENGKCGLFMHSPAASVLIDTDNMYLETKTCRKYVDLCGPYATYFKSKD